MKNNDAQSKPPTPSPQNPQGPGKVQGGERRQARQQKSQAPFPKLVRDAPRSAPSVADEKQAKPDNPHQEQVPSKKPPAKPAAERGGLKLPFFQKKSNKQQAQGKIPLQDQVKRYVGTVVSAVRTFFFRRTFMIVVSVLVIAAVLAASSVARFLFKDANLHGLSAKAPRVQLAVGTIDQLEHWIELLQAQHDDLLGVPATIFADPEPGQQPFGGGNNSEGG